MSAADSRIQSSIELLIHREVDTGSFPSAVWAVGDSRGILASGALGHAALEPVSVEARLDTIYDVASLTKVLVTWTISLLAVEKGSVALESSVSGVLRELADTPYKATTWADFLSHRSGIDAWFPLYTKGRDRESYLRETLLVPPACAQRERVVYSDLGYLILQLAIERLFGRELDELAKEWIFEPLGMKDTTYRPPARLRERIAATEDSREFEHKMVRAKGIEFDGFPHGIVHGEVHDGNAWGMGGVAGHAGVFSTVEDLMEFGQRILAGPFPVGRSLVNESLRSHTEGMNDNRGLGWALYTSEGAGSVLSQSSFGHTGFTGTSLFIDPEADRVMVLLTNRMHPRSSGADMKRIRQEFHRLAIGGGKA